jgi:hypothetical protein
MSVQGRFSLINPSLADFLEYHFSNSEEERNKLLLGASTIEQFEHYYDNFFSMENLMSGIAFKEANWFAKLLVDKSKSLTCYQELRKEKNRDRYVRLRVSALLLKVINWNPADVKVIILSFVLKSVKNYPIEDINSESREYYIRIIRFAGIDSILLKYVLANWNSIVAELFKSSIKRQDFEDVKKLFDVLSQDYGLYIKDYDNSELLTECLNDLANEHTKDWVSDTSSIFSDEDWEDLKDIIKSDRRKIFEYFDLEDDWYDEAEFFDDKYLDKLIEKNRERQINRAANELNNVQQFEATEEADLVKEIELLFNGEFDPEFVQKKAEELYLPF